MKLSQCKHGVLVESIHAPPNHSVGMIVGLTQIGNTPVPLVKFSHLEGPIAFLSDHLKLYEE